MSRPEPIELRTWSAVRDALRSKDLRQAGYTEGAVVTADTLLDLHGEEHRARRRVENRLFRRETFAHWEHQMLGARIETTMGPFVEAGRGDLAQIGYRCAMNLTATIAGIDQDPADSAGTEVLFGIVKKFSEGATLMHSTRDKEQVRREVRAAMNRFDSEFYQPAWSRRMALISEVEAGSTDEAQLPRDVLTTLLRSNDRLGLSAEVLFREICFYLQAGAHSTSNAFVHTVDDIIDWSRHSGVSLGQIELGLVQRCVHESLRLSPASPTAYRSPVSDVTLADGTTLTRGSLVVLDLTAANCERAIFGDDAERFDPYRTVPEGIPRWGLSFGAGTHACVGAELDGGLEIDPSRPESEQLYGTVAVMAHAFLGAGGRRDPEDPPTLDSNSTRKHYSSYPVVFGS